MSGHRRGGGWGGLGTGRVGAAAGGGGSGDDGGTDGWGGRWADGCGDDGWGDGWGDGCGDGWGRDEGGTDARGRSRAGRGRREGHTSTAAIASMTSESRSAVVTPWRRLSSTSTSPSTGLLMRSQITAATTSRAASRTRLAENTML